MKEEERKRLSELSGITYYNKPKRIYLKTKSYIIGCIKDAIWSIQFWGCYFLLRTGIFKK